jgi:hypothetical protein
MMGTGVYMSFPDVRGLLEDFYINLYHGFDSIRKVAEDKKLENPVQTSTRLPLVDPYTADSLEWFVNTFEDGKPKNMQNYVMHIAIFTITILTGLLIKTCFLQPPNLYLNCQSIAGKKHCTFRLIGTGERKLWRQCLWHTRLIVCTAMLGSLL